MDFAGTVGAGHFLAAMLPRERAALVRVACENSSFSYKNASTIIVSYLYPFCYHMHENTWKAPSHPIIDIVY